MNSEKGIMKKLYQNTQCFGVSSKVTRNCNSKDPLLALAVKIQKENHPLGLEVEKGTEIIPCRITFLEEMQNSALGPKVPGHTDQSGLRICSPWTWLLLSCELKLAPFLLGFVSPHTPSTLLWLRGVALLPPRPLLQARPCWVVDPLLEGGSHSCVSGQRPELLAGHEAEEKQLTTPLSSLPAWEMCTERGRAGS